MRQLRRSGSGVTVGDMRMILVAMVMAMGCVESAPPAIKPVADCGAAPVEPVVHPADVTTTEHTSYIMMSDDDWSAIETYHAAVLDWQACMTR